MEPVPLRRRTMTGATGDVEMGNRSPRQPENGQNDGTNVQPPTPDTYIENGCKAPLAAAADGAENPAPGDTRFKTRHIATMVFGERRFDLINLIPNRYFDRHRVLFESGYSLWIGGPLCLIMAYLWTGSIQYAFTVTLTSNWRR